MTTENRSSNTEMVSSLLPCPFCGEKPEITKHYREDIYSFMHRCPVLGPISWGFREDPQAHAEKWNARVQPAQQHQGEPAAYLACGELFKTVMGARNYAGSMPVYPLFKDVPVGADMNARCEELRKEVRSREALIDDLRARLAERDALLRELADAPPAAMEFRLQQKVKAALSASAEPSAPLVKAEDVTFISERGASAPVEIDERAENK